ncbi:uncharacterized protein AAEQ78_001806 [Lycaon pictus]
MLLARGRALRGEAGRLRFSSRGTSAAVAAVSVRACWLEAELRQREVALRKWKAPYFFTWIAHATLVRRAELQICFEVTLIRNMESPLITSPMKERVFFLTKKT